MSSSPNNIILGTVQFGLPYGINNKHGQPDAERVFALLDYAYEQGVRLLDSADAYGSAPDLIGSYHRSRPTRFEVSTKFKSGLHFNAEDWLSEQLEKYSIPALYACMFHDFQDYLDNRAVIFPFKNLIQRGLIQKMGVSVYTNEQLAVVIDDADIAVIQLPFNLLDNTLQRGTLLAKAKTNGKEIHIRSVFLQGLFFMDLYKLPDKLIPLRPALEKLHQLSDQYAIPLASMALAYAVSNRTIDKILVGVDTLGQLQDNLQKLDQILPDELVDAIDTLAVKRVDLLNPTNWT